jgi:hypothetical protein
VSLQITVVPRSWYPSLKRLYIIAALLTWCASSVADVKPLPNSQWPRTVAQAVPLIIANLTVSQKSIIRGTSKDSLQQLQAEWGDDIEQLFGLNDGNTTLISAACGRPCKTDEATLILMEAAWSALQQ